MLRLSLNLAIAVLLSGCAAQMAYREGNELVSQDKVEAGLVKYQEAVVADPTNVVYKTAYLRARDGATNRLLTGADRLIADGKAELALQNYQRVLAIDPVNDRARAGLRQVEADRRHAVLIEEARAAFERKEYEAARQKLGAILSERPSHEPARRLLAEVNDKASVAPAEAALAQAFRTPISLEFRDAPIKQIFEVIARHSGLNFVFDKDVKTDQRASIFLKNSTVESAVYYLLMTNQLERQVMDGNTILIYPNVAAKQKEYQEMTVKTFYLANADAKSIANTLKTILKSRDVVVDEKLNLVILRDSPEAVKLATQLVAAAGRARARSGARRRGARGAAQPPARPRRRLADLAVLRAAQERGRRAAHHRPAARPELQQYRYLRVFGAPSRPRRPMATPTRWRRRASACATRKRPRSSLATSCRPSPPRSPRAWAASSRNPSTTSTSA
jgi:general secretion pathway protein D